MLYIFSKSHVYNVNKSKIIMNGCKINFYLCDIKNSLLYNNMCGGLQ